MNKIDARLAQSTVLLWRQYFLINRIRHTYSEALPAFESAVDRQNETVNHVFDVYNYVFALVDHMIRYYKIAFGLPRLNRRDPQLAALNETVGVLKPIRHQFQHIDNEIENNYSSPLLGAVCWISARRQYIATFHDVGRTRSSPGIPIDTHTGRFVHDFCFVHNDVYYDIAKAIAGIEAFHSFTRASITVQIDGEDFDPKKHYTAAGVDIRLLPSGDSSRSNADD